MYYTAFDCPVMYHCIGGIQGGQFSGARRTRTHDVSVHRPIRLPLDHRDPSPHHPSVKSNITVN